MVERKKERDSPPTDSRCPRPPPRTHQQQLGPGQTEVCSQQVHLSRPCGRRGPTSLGYPLLSSKTQPWGAGLEMALPGPEIDASVISWSLTHYTTRDCFIPSFFSSSNVLQRKQQEHMRMWLSYFVSQSFLVTISPPHNSRSANFPGSLRTLCTHAHQTHRHCLSMWAA